MQDAGSSSPNDSPREYDALQIRPHPFVVAGVRVFAGTRRYAVLRDSLLAAGLDRGTPVDASILGLLAGLEREAAPIFCREQSLRLLATRDHSSTELSRKLVSRGYSPEVVADVRTVLRDEGLVDDARFARAYADSVTRKRSVSRIALIARLRDRGVPAPVAAQAVAELEANNPGLFENALKRAVESMPDRGRISRETLRRRLLSRGFTFSEIQKL